MNKNKIYILVFLAFVSTNASSEGFFDSIKSWVSKITEPVKPPVKEVKHITVVQPAPALIPAPTEEELKEKLIPEEPVINVSPVLSEVTTKKSKSVFSKRDAKKVKSIPVEFTNSYTLKDPSTNDDTYVMDEGDSIVINPLDNDFLPEGLGFRLISISESKNAMLEINGDNITVMPLDNFNGKLKFDYVIGSKKNETLNGNIVINIEPINDRPIAKADMFLTAEDTPVLLPSILSNDFDADGDNLKIISNSEPVHGELEFDSGIYMYTPNDDFNGIDTFEYVISDAHGATSKSQVSIIIKAMNDEPTAIDNNYEVMEDEKIKIGNFLDNDFDIDNDLFYINSFTKPSYGVLSYTGSKFLYIPEKNFHGMDYFYYTIEDTKNTSSTAKITITVRAVNDQPTAVADRPYELLKNTTLIIDDIHENDHDIDGDDIKISDHTRPLNGELSFDNKYTFTYIPNPDFVGIDRFTYAVSDGKLSSNISSVELVVKEDEIKQDSATMSINKKQTAIENQPEVSATDILKEIELINQH